MKRQLLSNFGVFIENINKIIFMENHALNDNSFSSKYNFCILMICTQNVHHIHFTTF